MIRTDPIASVVGILVLVAVLLTAGLCYWHLQCSRQLQRLQAQTALVNRNRAVVQSLVSEVMEYSKKNPAVDPILQSMGLKPKGATNTARPKP